LSLILTSCWEKKIIKKVKWKDYVIVLEVNDGGATTSYYWNVTAHSQFLIFTREKKLFSSYSCPYIEDITIVQNTLNISCLGESQKKEVIRIDLSKIEEFDPPVRYNRCFLADSNNVYQEPEFVKEQRKGMSR
jgi:hypothetical protein